MNSKFFRQLLLRFQHRKPTCLSAAPSTQRTTTIIRKTFSPTVIPINITSKTIRNAVAQSIRYLYYARQNLWSPSSVPRSQRRCRRVTFLTASVLSFLVGKDPDGEETPEDKLVMAIKRSILCIQRGQYDKAEQMLHLALRMAQDLHSKDGVTYVFDVMANLAMERAEYKKAEKLFVSVMQRLLADGLKENDIKMLHISSKIAHMQTLQGALDRAKQGFEWTLSEIEKQTERLRTDNDLQELLGLTKDWWVKHKSTYFISIPSIQIQYRSYAQLLMQLGRFAEAKNNFVAALDVYTHIHGRDNPEVVSLLNNLAVVCTNVTFHILK